MIKTGLNTIDDIRALINVPSVQSLVDFIRPFENLPSDYSNKKKFITVGFLAGDAADVQRGTVNVNAYAPDDAAGNANITFFKNVETVLIIILKDAYTNEMEIEIATTPKVLRDQDVQGYHFLNIRLNIYHPSITI
ncbi:MAG: hypothetical protein ACTHLB_05485 [Parafilimonas sp.]